MERFGWGKTNKKDAVLSFYFKTSVVGIYSIYLQTSGSGTRRRMISFNVADTNWNRYEIPISADTVALSGAGNSFGMLVAWQLINVPNYEYTGGTDTGWGEGIYLTDDGQVDFMGTSNILYLTGVQLELGSNATPFEHRSYGEELARCHRYYTIIPTQFGQIALGDGSTNGVLMLTVPVPLRHTPAIEQINSVNHRIYKDGYVVSTSNHIGFNSYTADTCFVKATFAGFSSITLGHTYQWLPIGSYKLGINAEL